MNETESTSIAMSPSIAAIAPALVAAQTEMGGAHKGATNPFYKSKYADLSEVIQTCKEAMNAQGISFLQPIVSGANGGVCVTTLLLHKSGEWLSASVEFPVAKIDPQEYGKAVSYARRYSLQSFLSIPAEDDDGNAAANKGTASNYTKAMTADFPEGAELTGVLNSLSFPTGGQPGYAMIQTEHFDSPMRFQVLETNVSWMKALAKPVVFTWAKPEGSKAGTMAIATLDCPTPHMVPTTEAESTKAYQETAKMVDIDIPGEKLPQATDEYDGQPGEEAFFEPGKDVRGVLVSFKEDETKTGKYVCRLVFECASGIIDVTAWDKAGKWDVNWGELMDRNVWFNATEGREFRGKRQFNLQDVSLFN